MFSFLFAIILAIGDSVHAQSPAHIFRHITVNEGLLTNHVSAIMQDKQGYIWIGSSEGLQRYDGTRFINYLADIRDTSALQTDVISAVFEDSKNRLWVGTNSSAYTLDRRTGKFYNYNLHSRGDNKIKGIWHFAEDHQGTIWVAGHAGYYRLDEPTNQFVPANTELGLNPNPSTGGMTIDAQNNFWLATTNGIRLYNNAEHKLYDRTHNPNNEALFTTPAGIGDIKIVGNLLWASAQYARVLYQYNFTTKKIKEFRFDKLPGKKGPGLLDKEYVGIIFPLRNQQIVVPLPGRGLAFYNPVTDDFAIENSDNSQPYGYHTAENSENAGCFIQDTDQNVLISNDAGIHIYNSGKQKFFSHGVNAGGTELFPAVPVSDFMEMPNGDLLISYYELNGGIVKTTSDYTFKKRYLYKGHDNLSAVNQLWGMFLDKQGVIWAPTQGNTVLKLSTITDQLSESKDEVSVGPINNIQQDEDGIIWEGHWWRGLVRFDPTTKQTQSYGEFKTEDMSAPKRIYALLFDGNKIWTGTLQSGIQVFDKTLRRFTESYEVNERNKNAISSNTVKTIISYNKDSLLVASFMGINIFDKNKKTFKAITAKDGLPNNLVLDIMLDNQHNLWAICAGGGLCRINMRSFVITTYDINDGLIDNEFSGKLFKLKNGQLLIASSHSFISFDPLSFAASAPPRKVSITRFSIFDDPVLPDTAINKQNSFSLSYRQNSLRIEFASLDFWDANRLSYYYKLDGVDKDWILADKSQVAVYNQLSSGNYTFQVKCANRDGIFSTETTTLTIHIRPPFWKTRWFIILVSLLISLGVYLFIRWRENNIRAMGVEKLKVEKLSAEQYKSKLELEQIVNYFSSSLIDKQKVEDVLWDVARNLIGQIGFEDCMIYLWNHDKTKMEQRAGYGPKGSIEEIATRHFDVSPGQGVVGWVMETREPVLIPDTSIDNRYRVDDLQRSSELTVPIIYNNELLGIIDSEHHEKNFFTEQHLQVLSTIAALTASKIKSLEAQLSLQNTQLEMHRVNEQLSRARLEALRSQMNPHFIFNSLNAIQECIVSNKVEAAYEYLSKFSRLQRMVLNNSAHEFIPLRSELEMLELYLSLESLRFSQSFSYSIDIDKNTDPDEIIVPSMLLQPYVENAIWHGLRNKKGEKVLTINCKEQDGDLLLVIDDNGIGRENAAAIKAKKIGRTQGDSKGTILTEKRMEILAVKYNERIGVRTIDKINNNNEGVGTTVIITLPVNLDTKLTDYATNNDH